MKRPCSSCGRLLEASKNSLPEGQIKCRPCRRNAPPPPVEPPPTWGCVVCGAISTGLPIGKYCAAHRGTHRITCKGCGETAYLDNPARRYCSDECREAHGIARNGQPVKVRASRLDWKQCPCDAWICRPGYTYCSAECRPHKHYAPDTNPRRCPDCGVQLERSQQRCEDCREKRTAETTKRHRRNYKSSRPRNGYRRKHRDRARHYGVEYELVIRKKVYIRDGWVCGICDEPVDEDLKYPDLMSASLDHVIPMSRGGGHTYANTQCAHFICNSRKSNRLQGEFELVG